MEVDRPGASNMTMHNARCIDLLEEAA